MVWMACEGRSLAVSEGGTIEARAEARAEAKGYAEGESNPCRLLSVIMEGKHDNHFTIGV
jgi:hypothetical protein